MPVVVLLHRSKPKQTLLFLDTFFKNPCCGFVWPSVLVLVSVLFFLCRDLRPKALTGSKMEKICDKVHITLNKNAVQVSQWSEANEKIASR